MKQMIILLLAILVCVLPVPGTAEESGKASEDYDPLWKEAEPYGFKLGGCFGFQDMNNKAYMDFLARHFNSLTCTNETKAYSLLDKAATRKAEDGMPRMKYNAADKMIAWAAENGIRVRGHVLVWDAVMQYPWFFHEDYDEAKPFASREVNRARLACYIERVISHFEEKFPGVIYCWDVVNEAIGDSASDWRADDPRHIRIVRDGGENMFQAHVGDDYVEYAFLCARNTLDQIGADIRLFYNDYNLFFPQKRKAACELVKSIQAYATDENGNARKLIDGVGMQGYMGGYGEQAGCLDPQILTNVKESIRIYADLGVEVQLTEMAVRNFDKTKVREHDEFYAKLFSDVFMKANTAESAPLTAVCIWGLVDADPNNRDYVYKMNSPYGCLLNRQYRIKTCFEAISNALKGQ